MLGTVEFFDAARGFGFITPDVGKDVFVHITAVHAAGMDTLSQGQRVTFDVQRRYPRPKGGRSEVGVGPLTCIRVGTVRLVSRIVS